MAKSALDVIEIARNVTGRVDPSDPLFTNEIMLQRLNDFISLISSNEIRLSKNYTWYKFDILSTSADPFPIVLDTLVLDNGSTGATTIGPLAYIDGFKTAWYQDPGSFYQKWPETQTYTSTRPTDILYYNNKLTFRNPPDKSYSVKIQAYSQEILNDSSSNLNNDYLFRYLAYGMALDIFFDFGESDKANEILPAFNRYKGFVWARTNLQYQNQRPSPEF